MLVSFSYSCVIFVRVIVIVVQKTDDSRFLSFRITKCCEIHFTSHYGEIQNLREKRRKSGYFGLFNKFKIF